MTECLTPLISNLFFITTDTFFKNRQKFSTNRLVNIFDKNYRFISDMDTKVHLL